MGSRRLRSGLNSIKEHLDTAPRWVCVWRWARWKKGNESESWRELTNMAQSWTGQNRWAVWSQIQQDGPWMRLLPGPRPRRVAWMDGMR